MIAGEQLGGHFLQPFRSLATLALRTRAVSTGIVLNITNVPALATFDMGAEATGPAVSNSPCSSFHVRS